MTHIPKINGLVAAPFTPMHPNSDLNLDLIPDYARFLVHNGVKGAFIGGSTGEGVSLSFTEKLALLRAWGETTEPDLQKIMLVGGTSLTESRELTREAAQSGFDAVAVLAPFYFKPTSAQVLADFCVQVGEAAPEVGLYFYHIPALTGVTISMLQFLEAIDGRLPNFRGIKYTHNDLMEYRQCLLFDGGKYDLLWGWDEIFLAAMAMGARGAVGSTFNYAAPVYHELMEAFDKGDISRAQQMQDQSIAIVRLLGKYGGIATGKAFMRAVGLDCGTFRLPVQNMTDERYEDFLHDLSTIQFDQYASQPITQAESVGL
ncbi:dihydrodipicolinate synthase family protein [Fibrella sp. HMF5335]|uniref:Dihydrodipicolinate synthase family protein n=1 Tax=Fibrella rubiginis TaxID=2817060 RepID=A0A939GEM4_9BACT|nr:dihydrodipicolinate synthase family protein [Fibrella rubiginis]MBO0936373.1 dihydrodipicolinate synthase family protein [Fibrella rubiginis]